MIISKKHLLLVLTALIFLIGCSDDDNNSPEPEPTVSELLTSGRWYVEAHALFEQTDCTRRTSFQFLESGDFIIVNFNEDGAGDCVEDSSAGTYEFTSENQMLITTPGDTVGIEIVHISETLLVIKLEGSISILLDKTEG